MLRFKNSANSFPFIITYVSYRPVYSLKGPFSRGFIYLYVRVDIYFNVCSHIKEEIVITGYLH